MPIKGPKGAEPTIRGWVNPKTGELLKSQKISQAQVDEWHGIITEVTINDIHAHGKIEAAMAAFEAETKVDADDVISDNNNDGVIDELESLTKIQIEEHGREMGIELDRRKNKTNMIQDLKDFLKRSK